MTALYNEIDAHAAAWTRNLIAAGHVAPGVVDERSIADLVATDVAGPGQRHFFSGIAVWSHALRLAGVPDDADVWTASCPCQPFSGAGQRRGFSDERHLWPELRRLVEECRPAVLIGEQVASRDGRTWFAAVRADLEALGYAVGAADLCAAGVGAPHIRQRLYFVAYTDGAGRQGRTPHDRVALSQAGWCAGSGDGGESVKLAYAACNGRIERLDEREGEGDRARSADHRGAIALAHPEDERRGSRRLDSAHGWTTLEPERLGDDGGLGHSSGARHDGREDAGTDRDDARALAEESKWRTAGDLESERTGATSGFWSACDWLPCSDGKSRPVEPGTFPLAHGATGRVGKLRAYGNAIVPQVAAAFVRAALGLDPSTEAA